MIFVDLDHNHGDNTAQLKADQIAITLAVVEGDIKGSGRHRFPLFAGLEDINSKGPATREKAIFKRKGAIFIDSGSHCRAIGSRGGDNAAIAQPFLLVIDHDPFDTEIIICRRNTTIGVAGCVDSRDGEEEQE